MTEISLPALIRKLVATGVELPEGNGSELDVLEAVYQLAQVMVVCFRPCGSPSAWNLPAHLSRTEIIPMCS